MSLPKGSDDSSELSGCWRLVEGQVGLEDMNAIKYHLLFLLMLETEANMWPSMYDQNW